MNVNIPQIVDAISVLQKALPPTQRKSGIVKAPRAIDVYGGMDKYSQGSIPAPEPSLPPGIQMPGPNDPGMQGPAYWGMPNDAVDTVPSLPNVQASGPSRYDAMTAQANRRMDQGDQMQMDALNAPRPSYHGPTFGTKDLLLGLLPTALALTQGGHRGIEGALGYATNYLGGKNAGAEQNYARDLGDYNSDVSRRAQVGQLQSAQGQRMLAHADEARSKGMSIVQNLANRIAMVKDPSAIPLLVRGINQSARDAGLDGMEISDDEAFDMMKSVKEAADEKTAYSAGFKALQAFNAAKTGKDKLVSGTALIGIANRFPHVLSELGTTMDSIQKGLGDATEWEKAQTQKRNLDVARGLFYQARTQTENELRQPKEEYLKAGTGLRTQERLMDVERTKLLGLNETYLPKEFALKERQANAAIDKARADIASGHLRDERLQQQINMAGDAKPDTIAHLSADWNKRAISAQAELKAYQSKQDSIMAQLAGIKNGTIKLPATDSYGQKLDPNAVNFQLNADLNEVESKIAKAKFTYDESVKQQEDLKTRLAGIQSTSKVPGQPAQQAPAAGIVYVGNNDATKKAFKGKGDNRLYSIQDVIDNMNGYVANGSITRDQALQKLKALGITAAIR